MWEGVAEGRYCLDRWVSVLSDWVRVIEAEQTLDLVKGHSLLYLDRVGVQVLDVLCVQEDESLLRIEAEGDDVLNV